MLDFRTHARRLLTTLVGITSLVVASLAFVSPAQAAGETTTTISRNASSVTVNVANGSVSTANGHLAIRNGSGQVIFQMPLTYRNEYLQLPIDASSNGTTATLTPSKNVARATLVNPAEVESVRHQAAAPETRQERDDAALARFNQALSAGLTISTLIGTGIGAVVGGAIGCAIGLTAAVVGCLVAVAPAAALGGVIGTVIGGGGTLIVAGVQYLQTLNSPFVPPK